jgi:NADH:ubiquinone oxidoreductase subunit K
MITYFVLPIIGILCWLIATNYRSLLVTVLYFELSIVFSALLFMSLAHTRLGMSGIQGELYLLSVLTVGAIEMSIIISLLVAYYRLKGMLTITVFNLIT